MIDYSTKNTSFLDVQKELEQQGIKNNAFMLQLNDEDLKGLDMDDLSQSGDSALWKKLSLECIANPWYYFREVVKIPKAGGGNMPLPIDQGLLAQIFIILNEQSYWRTGHRQSLKTTTSAAILDYFARYWNKPSVVISKSLADARTVRGKMTAHNFLPSVYSSPEFPSDATNIGRSGSHAEIILIDEAEFVHYTDLLTEFILSQEGKHRIMFNSVINDHAEEYGAINVLRSATKWNNKFYDIGLLQEPALYHIDFHWKELNRPYWNDTWYEELSRMIDNPEVVRRELDCIRNPRKIVGFVKDQRLS